MKRLLLLFALLFVLTACHKEDREVKLQVYTVEGCGYCDTFEKEGIPYLQSKFSQISFEYIDLDDHEEDYDQLICQLVDFDQDYYKDTPVIVFEPYFVVVGYQSGEEKALANDIQHALNGEKLGNELEAYRWEFQS